ncbi:MAG: hypothetical protein IPM46_07970 [Flavobacteriales bacterium]|nr:hypothetical protein [Flavobacteriales bacterium]
MIGSISNNAPKPDGWFDFIDGAATVGGTIQAQTGRVYFGARALRQLLDRQLIGPDPE